jgi:hypothetical protein
VRRRQPSSAPFPAVSAAVGDRARDRPPGTARRPAPRPRRPVEPRRAPGDAQAARPAVANLTAAGAAVCSLGGTVLAGFVDHLLTDGLGVLFGIAFVAVTVFVAWTVRAQDWAAAIIAPPIAFATTIVLVSTFLADDTSESYLTRVGLDLLSTLSFKAGLLWGGTALAAVVVLGKRRINRGP